MPDLSVDLGKVRLKNPLIAGSCEFTMTEAGIRACLDAGAGAVVAKSINESPEAARQLNIADYVLLRPDWRLNPWEHAALDDTLFCRSGLAQTPLDDWLELLARADAYARRHDAYVIGSITVAEAAPAAAIAARMAEAVRCIELNLGAPHGKETRGGAVRQVTEADVAREFTAHVRRAVPCPLIVKLGQTNDVVGMAAAVVEAGADAVAMIGRFSGFMPDIETMEPVLGSWGAIGGPWALPISLYWVSKSWRALPRSVPIIGTNGARSGEDVVRFLLSGARAVEVASPLLMHGAGALGEMLRQVEAYALRKGLMRIEEIVGVAADRARQYGEIPPRAEPLRPWAHLLTDGG